MDHTENLFSKDSPTSFRETEMDTGRIKKWVEQQSDDQLSVKGTNELKRLLNWNLLA